MLFLSIYAPTPRTQTRIIAWRQNEGVHPGFMFHHCWYELELLWGIRPGNECWWKHFLLRGVSPVGKRLYCLFACPFVCDCAESDSQQQGLGGWWRGWMNVVLSLYWNQTGGDSEWPTYFVFVLGFCPGNDEWKFQAGMSSKARNLASFPSDFQNLILNRS